MVFANGISNPDSIIFVERSMFALHCEKPIIDLSISSTLILPCAVTIFKSGNNYFWLSVSFTYK